MVFGAIFPTTEAAENPAYDSTFGGGVGGGVVWWLQHCPIKLSTIWVDLV